MSTTSAKRVYNYHKQLFFKIKKILTNFARYAAMVSNDAFISDRRFYFDFT